VKNPNAQKSDIPLPAAVVLLVVVMGVVFGASRGYDLNQIGLQIEDFFDRHGGIITLSVLAIFANVFSIHTCIARYLSYRRQGSRLRDLTGSKDMATQRLWQTTIAVSSLSAVYGVALYIGRHLYGIVVSPLELPSTFLFLMILNMALAAAIITHWFWLRGNGSGANRKVSVLVRKASSRNLIRSSLAPVRLMSTQMTKCLLS